MTTIDQVKAWADEEAATAPEADRERVRAEYVGAAVADSMFCPSCGRRGFVVECPSCARCE